MAILKMKKLRLMAVRSRKDALLKELIRFGCVEFSELEGEFDAPELEGSVKREGADIATLKTKHSSLSHAITLLDSYAPKKSKMLSAKPELDEAELLDDTGLTGALKVAETIEGLDARIKRVSAEESRQRSIIESLQPWFPLEMPLNMDGTERCGILLGTVPVKVEIGQVAAAMEQIDEESDVFLINEDKRVRYIAAIFLREQLSQMQDCLRGFGFTAASLGGMEGSARECALRANEQLRELAEEKESCRESIVAEAVRRDELKLAADRVSVKIALAEAEDKLYGTETTVVMEGWIPEEREEELEQVFERFGCAWETVEPTEDEYPEVPVKLKNNKITNALNMVTDMYSLPAYGSLDPNPLMAPFFILFYGLMMADVGYGILMVLAAVIAMKKIKPRKGSLSFCQLLLYGGISTFIIGALTGSFFGDALVQVGKILGKPDGWGQLPALFSPMNDSMLVLVASLGLGLIHLNTGMVINVYKKCKRGQIADAVWEEGALWIILIGIVLAVLKVGNVAGIPVVLVVGVVMLLFGSSRSARGFGKLAAVGGTLYNTITGWFGDVLSYSRLMALMLAGNVIASVFNTIGGIANSFWLFIPVFVIGHALNFALNLLGCYVHDLRLQCLEFFGKFYEDGGRAFEPLELKTQYYNVAE